MSDMRKKRAEERAKHSDPINYTCGVCKQVHPFDPEKPYECSKEEQE